VLVAVLGAAGCSSSSPAAQQSQLPPSVAPATTVTTPASSTPPPSPSTSAKPLSAFEKDPAVIALRAWAAQAAKTVNSGHYTDKALQALMTPALAKTMKHVMGNVVGQHMPGPVPFTPIAVKRISARERYIDACFVTNGFAVNPKTGKHEHSRVVTAIDTGAHLVDGTWKTDAFFNGKFSCKGVAIPEPTW
jgi:hypothetical protein